MNRKPMIALVPLAALAFAGSAQAQSQEKLNVGGQVGVYMPTSGRIRDAFGDSVLNYGISPFSNGQNKSSGSPNLEFLSANKNGNRLFIGSLTYGYERKFSTVGTSTPYARVFAGVAYFDYGIDQIGGRESGKRFGWTSGAEVGLLFVDRLRLSAKYNFYNKVDGFDFNGLTLSATLSLFKF